MQIIQEKDRPSTVIEAVATANPRFTVSQAEAAEFMMRMTAIPAPLRKRIAQVYDRSSIERRYSCVEDYTRLPDEFDFFSSDPDLPVPSTGARNQMYEREAVPLAVEAARRCLADSALRPDQITHLIVVSCTGFFAPGLDVALVQELGLPLSTQRTMIGFMGCYAAFNGLRTADDICRSHTNAVVLLVCVELCTLHFQPSDCLESVIVNALFSDGAAACLLRSASSSHSTGKLLYQAGATLLEPGSGEAMSWAIGDSGFIMGLSPRVPELIAGFLPGFVDDFLGRCGLERADVSEWAVHPGGRQVLDRASSCLNLPVGALDLSYSVLRDYGNMSSPTILFILKRIIDARPVAGDRIVAMAFGPGLTIEGCLLAAN